MVTVQCSILEGKVEIGGELTRLPFHFKQHVMALGHGEEYLQFSLDQGSPLLQVHFICHIAGYPVIPSRFALGDEGLDIYVTGRGTPGRDLDESLELLDPHPELIGLMSFVIILGSMWSMGMNLRKSPSPSPLIFCPAPPPAAPSSRNIGAARAVNSKMLLLAFSEASSIF